MRRTGDILVVDDEANIVDLISEVLNEEGYKVRRAHDGASALISIDVCLPSLILLDMSMPDMVGTTLLHQLRQQHNDELPVVIMTAGAHSPAALVAQGASGYLAKPFDLNDLIQCVSQYVDVAAV
ncbi:MAG: response regulator [Roseiflexaceae bacterium]|nr:response regulator [Roseiflexaceae bacterium]